MAQFAQPNVLDIVDPSDPLAKRPRFRNLHAHVPGKGFFDPRGGPVQNPSLYTPSFTQDTPYSDPSYSGFSYTSSTFKGPYRKTSVAKDTILEDQPFEEPPQWRDTSPRVRGSPLPPSLPLLFSDFFAASGVEPNNDFSCDTTSAIFDGSQDYPEYPSAPPADSLIVNSLPFLVASNLESNYYFPYQTSMQYPPDAQVSGGAQFEFGTQMDAQVAFNPDLTSNPTAPYQANISFDPQATFFPPCPPLPSQFPESSSSFAPSLPSIPEDPTQQPSVETAPSSPLPVPIDISEAPAPDAAGTASTDVPNQPSSSDEANQTVDDSLAQLKAPVDTAQVPKSVLKRLACSAGCDLCYDPPKLAKRVAKEKRHIERMMRPKHTLGVSLLSLWITNVFSGKPQVNHNKHWFQTVNDWIEAQTETIPVDELWEWIVEETRLTEEDCETARWWPLDKSFRAYTTFMVQLQLGVPRDVDQLRSLDNETMIRATRHLAIAVRLLQSEEPKFLKRYYSLEFYVDMLATAASFVLALFGYEDWIVEGVRPARVDGKPIWSWYRFFTKDLRTIRRNQKKRIRTFKQAWPWLHRKNLRKSGRYQDNRPYYIPTKIVDSNGDVVVNVGHIYITSMDSHEKWLIEQYELAKAYYRKYPEKRPRIARNLIVEDDPVEAKRDAFIMGYVNWYRATQPMPETGSVYTTIPMREPTPEDPWFEWCKIPEPEPLGLEPKPIDPYHDPTNDEVDTTKIYMM
ncbi:hypothetical protein Dda_0358 [Drechslerella dactyloides]|uniref:Uncharacterized protein n=1 Tax=Drechslerella dactyloides TaxID=74499 RepID=A0AAD6J4T5_DREDA|nr:hypothetical protein Dda_0358 [Drechslerella dactyloides]